MGIHGIPYLIDSFYCCVDCCVKPNALDAYHNDEITAAAGGSAHEVKTWVAAVAAMEAACAGRWHSAQRYYREIPEWIAGFGALSGRSG